MNDCVSLAVIVSPSLHHRKMRPASIKTVLFFFLDASSKLAIKKSFSRVSSPANVFTASRARSKGILMPKLVFISSSFSPLCLRFPRPPHRFVPGVVCEPSFLCAAAPASNASERFPRRAAPVRSRGLRPLWLTRRRASNDTPPDWNAASVCTFCTFLTTLVASKRRCSDLKAKY